MRLEDEVPAVLDLRDRIETRQAHLAAFLLGELRPENQCPVIELFADDRRAEAVGGGLQGCHIVHGEERIVVFAESDLAARQFSFDERVAVEVIGGVEREKTCHAHDDGAEHLIAEVEVVMCEAAALMRQNPIVRIGCRVLWDADPKGPTLLHAFEDEVDTVSVLLLHAP